MVESPISLRSDGSAGSRFRTGSASFWTGPPFQPNPHASRMGLKLYPKGEAVMQTEGLGPLSFVGPPCRGGPFRWATLSGKEKSPFLRERRDLGRKNCAARQAAPASGHFFVATFTTTQSL